MIFTENLIKVLSSIKYEGANFTEADIKQRLKMFNYILKTSIISNQINEFIN